MIRESLVAVLDGSAKDRRVVGTAETEEDAFQMIARNDADVAIIDINLRQGSGIGLLARLREMPDAPRLRIVYTNHYSRRIHEHCAKLGATHVLSKSGDVHELLDVLDHRDTGPRH